MKEKRKDCLYCGKEMEDVKTIRKKFCSDLCRVNFNNEAKVKNKPLDQKIKEYFSKVTPDEIIADYESLGYTFSSISKINIKPNTKESYNGRKNALENAARGRDASGINEDEVKREAEINKHPLWEEGDPKENTMAFVMKYDCNNYDELSQAK